MIDIIIPAYNAHETILKTLLSIEIQTMAKQINVYIVDDASDKDYEEIKNMFNKTLNIKIIRNEKNIGPGLSRQKALEESQSEYIVFIDSDDIFYDIYAIENLYENIKSCDSIWGIVVEQKNKEEYICVKGKETYLHGKMYRRSVIDKYNLKFFNARNHEDCAFNMLYKDSTKNVYLINKEIYVYNFNNSSITNNTDLEKNIYNYIKVYQELIEEEIKRKTDKKTIAEHIYICLLYIYFNYNLYNNKRNLDFIFKEMGKIKDYYKEYDILKEENKTVIYNNFEYNVVPFITFKEFMERVEK